jgi:amidase
MGSFDLDFASALEAAEAIGNKQISSVELTQRMFERIDRFNPALRAFVYELRNGALTQAKKADEATARGESLGPFHGVPISIKETFGIEGHPATWGLPAFKDIRSTATAASVARLIDGGAVVLGATNVSKGLADWQSYNDVYGTTNNPWNLERVPGGSSGGSAAAIAAGLSYLSLGSDLGGSLRIPAHCCGIFAHKPTVNLISTQGLAPGGAWHPPGLESPLAVAGPMARSAADLHAALKVLGGPTGYAAKAWQWRLPPPRATRLREFRVGFVIDDPVASPSPELRAVLEQSIGRLDRAGVQLKSGWPRGFQFETAIENFSFHLQAMRAATDPPTELKGDGAAHSEPILLATWLRETLQRLAIRDLWQQYFNDVDVFLSPIAVVSAFPHDHSEPKQNRILNTSSGPRSYMELRKWISIASLTGCPATAAPAGVTADGLPVGIQIIGPFWEDATPIRFAELFCKEFGSFRNPPGYASGNST